MILADTPVFPNNIVDLIALRSSLLDEEIRVFKRPLRPTDPAVSVGVFGQLWTPDEESYEMRGMVGTAEPTISTYQVMIQAFVKDFDETRGLARHSVLSKMIRTMLYRDIPLGVALRELSVTMFDSTERTRRYQVRSQRYISNELQGDFLYLSTLDFHVDTETS